MLEKKSYEVGQVLGLEVDHYVPAQWRDLCDDLLQRVRWDAVDEALDEVEAYSTDTGLVQLCELIVGHVTADGGDAACTSVAASQCVDQGAVVGTVAGCLDDHVAVEAEAGPGGRRAGPAEASHGVYLRSGA